jgi:hypothetical protein
MITTTAGGEKGKWRGYRIGCSRYMEWPYLYCNVNKTFSTYDYSKK